jgi:hypothetical protein
MPIGGRCDLHGANRASAGKIGYSNGKAVIRRGYAGDCSN